MKVSSDPGFWEFHQKRVDGGPCEPCRTLGGTEYGKGRGCKTRKEVVEDREPTDLSAMVKRWAP